MDFAREHDEVRTFLTARGFRVAVIGGVALAAYGNPRLTLDLDVVTDAAAQDTLVEMMEAEGFATLEARWEEAFSRLLLAEALLEKDARLAQSELIKALPVLEELRSLKEAEYARALLEAVPV